MHVDPLTSQLHQLRTRLVDLAFTLDGQHQPVAADVAMTTAATLTELLEQHLAFGRQMPRPAHSPEPTPAARLVDSPEPAPT